MLDIVLIVVAAVVGALAGWMVDRRNVANALQDLRDAQEQLGMAEMKLAHQSVQLSSAEEREARLQDVQQQLRDLLSQAQERMGVQAGRLQHLGDLESQFDLLQQQSLSQAERLAAKEEQTRLLQSQQQEVQQLRQELSAQQQQLMQQSIRSQELETLLQLERSQAEEKQRLLQEARESLGKEFKLLAQDVLEEKSRRFSEQSQVNLNQLLMPFDHRLQQFGKLVQETHEKESKERLTLENELRRLQALNSRLNEDAIALTQALTGSNNKAQGNWGEMILERVLESSGLSKDREYRLQVSDKLHDDEGSIKRYQPDVVIYLPEGKHLVIDSKVSLNAYVRHSQAADAVQAASELKQHVQALRQHIRTLSEKRYQDLYQLQTVDFVFMFIPVEPAYLLAVQHDMSLFNEAFERRIVIVGPSTLLATLRTVASIWRYENQNRHAQEIARQGGLMYDKLVGVIDSVQRLGKQIESAQDGYQLLMRQMSTGSGNLLSRAERMRKLGARNNKQLPAQLLSENATGEDENFSLPEDDSGL